MCVWHTNPVKEEQGGFNLGRFTPVGGRLGRSCRNASDSFELKYEFACRLKGDGLCLWLKPRRNTQYRGTLTEPGKESPYRNRRGKSWFICRMHTEFWRVPVLRAKLIWLPVSESARSGALPYTACLTPQDRRQVVYLPHVWLWSPLHRCPEGITHSLYIEYTDTVLYMTGSWKMRRN